MLKRTLFAAAAFALVLFFAAPAAFGASQWDFSENWDSGYSDNWNFPTSEPSSKGWYAGDNQSSYSGPYTDTQNRRSNSYSAKVNCENTSTYGYTYRTNQAWLMYKLPSALPASGDLVFYRYIYYASLRLEYSTDGSNWSTVSVIASSDRTYERSWNKETHSIPSGARYIRFYSQSPYIYYYYGCWIDDISFTLPLAEVTSVSGYSTTGPNTGVLNLTATATGILGTVTSVKFEYKSADDSDFVEISTDSSSSGGWTCEWDTGSLFDPVCKLRVTPYVGSDAGNIFLDKLNVENPEFDGFGSLAEYDGENIGVSASFSKPESSVVWPENEWTGSYTGYSSYGRTIWNTAVTSPMAGTYTGYETYFSYVRSGSAKHRYFLFEETSPPSSYSYVRIVAAGPTNTSKKGKQTYNLTSGFSNMPAGLFQGAWVYYTSYYDYSGNPSDFYYYSTSTYRSSPPGVGVSFNGYSYNRYGAPVRGKIEVKGSYPDMAQFAYSTDKQSYTVFATEVVSSTGEVSADFDSFNYIPDQEEIYFGVRAYYNGSWAGWNWTEDTVHVINSADVSFDTAMGDGYLQFRDVTNGDPFADFDVPFTQTVRVGWENTYEYEVNAPTYQLEQPEDMRWVYDRWDNGGDQTQMFTVDGTDALNVDDFLAHYRKQHYFSMQYPPTVTGVTGPADGYYDEGTQIVATAPSMIVVTAFEERYFCNGWEVAELGLTSDVAEAQFYLTDNSTLVWLFTHEFSLLVDNDRGQSTGAAGGWYEEGSSITVSVNEFLEEGDSRWAVTGYTGSGSVGSGSGSSTGQFTIVGPTVVSWHWKRQHYVELSTNFGTTEPPAGWFDEGAVVDITSVSPPNTNWYRYDFVSWEGEGPGSIDYVGPNPDQQITVMGPISQHATWEEFVKLEVTAENGSLPQDPSGWYPTGETVTIEADPPTADTGERWNVEWEAAEPGVTIERAFGNPRVVSVTLSVPVQQYVRFHKQFLLNVINANRNALVLPVPGYTWHYADEPVTGFAQFSTSNFICGGYDGEGSLGDGTDPFFEFVITQPTSVSWIWNLRPEVPEQYWNMPSEIVSSGASLMSSGILSDGTIVFAYYDTNTDAIHLMTGDGTTWSGQQIATQVGQIASISLVVLDNDEVLLAYYGADDNNLYTLTVTDAAVGSSGWAVNLFDDIGDVGRSVEISEGVNGEIYIAYLDNGNGAVKVATVEGATSTIETVPFDGIASLYCSLSVKLNDGHPVVAFYDTVKRGVFCAEKVGSDWLVEEVDTTGDTGHFCELETSPSGELYIAYQDLSVVNEPVTRLARKIGDVWSYQQVDSDVSGYGLEFELDSSAYPHIISNNGFYLRYSRHNGDDWEHITIPNPAGMGGVLSMVMLPVDKPGVFYLDEDVLGYIDAKADSQVNTGDTSMGETPDQGGSDDGDDTTGDGGGGGGGCFVATAAFGSLAADSVVALTTVRDGSLTASSVTSTLVGLYYEVSPPAAAAMSETDALRALVRELVVR
ncbi:MAG: CFI-box-CTERM domain-containing protein [Planctomycetota bacterium]|nr:CFI-box-CTERM domain-containing protein [Planctomycetota bacterium]